MIMKKFEIVEEVTDYRTIIIEAEDENEARMKWEQCDFDDEDVSDWRTGDDYEIKYIDECEREQNCSHFFFC